MTDYRTFAEQHLAIGLRSGSEYMVRCPYHDNHSFTMQFNIDKGLFICFSCGARGSVKRMAKDMGVRITDGDVDLTRLRSRITDILKPEDPPPHMDESVLARYRFPTTYWRSRGYTRDTVQNFDLGYDPMNNIATIPIRDTEGNLIGIIKRYLDDDALVRYRYPKHFSRSTNMFASWKVKDSDTDHVVLVEGALDAIKVWQAGIPAMAIYGSSITKDQITLLHRLGITKVTTFFDNDLAGEKALLCAIGIHRRKHRNKVTVEYHPETDLRNNFIVSKIDYDDHMPDDPGACTCDLIKKAFANRSILALT